MIAGGSAPRTNETRTVDDQRGVYHNHLNFKLQGVGFAPTAIRRRHNTLALPMTDDTPRLLSFPCDYPIKVMVRADPGVRGQVDRIVQQHAGLVDPESVTERSSAQNRFVGITYVIRATSEAQIAALFGALKLCPHVLLVL